MRSIMSGQEPEDQPVSNTLRHYVNVLQHRSSGMLREERMEVNTGGEVNGVGKDGRV